MFSNQIIVKGQFVSGTIKRNDGIKDHEKHPYFFHSELNLGSKNEKTWNSDILREIANELHDIVNELDRQNGVDFSYN